MYFNKMNTKRIFIILLSFAFSFIYAEGNVSYTLHKASNPTEDQLDAYARIEAAMDSAVLCTINTPRYQRKSMSIMIQSANSTSQF